MGSGGSSTRTHRFPIWERGAGGLQGHVKELQDGHNVPGPDLLPHSHGNVDHYAWHRAGERRFACFLHHEPVLAPGPPEAYLLHVHLVCLTSYRDVVAISQTFHEYLVGYCVEQENEQGVLSGWLEIGGATIFLDHDLS
jgi:hypothetical protein